MSRPKRNEVGSLQVEMGNPSLVRRDIMKQSPRFVPTNRLERYDLVNEKDQDLGQ
jgi:hypothetical protein